MITPASIKRHNDAQMILWDRIMELGGDAVEFNNDGTRHVFSVNTHLCGYIARSGFTAADIPLLNEVIEACSTCGPDERNCWLEDTNRQFVKDIRS